MKSLLMNKSLRNCVHQIIILSAKNSEPDFGIYHCVQQEFKREAKKRDDVSKAGDDNSKAGDDNSIAGDDNSKTGNDNSKAGEYNSKEASVPTAVPLADTAVDQLKAEENKSQDFEDILKPIIEQVELHLFLKKITKYKICILL